MGLKNKIEFGCKSGTACLTLHVAENIYLEEHNRKRETSVKNKNVNSRNAALRGELYKITKIATNIKFPLTYEHPNQLRNVLLDNLGNSGHPLTAEYSNLVLKSMQFNRVNIY